VFEPSGRSRAGVVLLAGLAWLAGCGGGASSTADAAPSAKSPAPAVAGRGAGAEDTTAPSGLRVTHLDVAGHDVMAEIADNGEARQQGLMFRDSLPADHGMLFVYPQEQTLSFWMRNTKIPLDIAFLTASGAIIDIQHMDAESDSLHTSRRPAMYALEMAAGWFADHGVQVGDRVAF
jgi:uncharacterized membrane protein (UPF0127 family)